MLKESIVYKIIIFLYRFLKESRIYEIVSKLFYYSRYSIIFELVGKEAEQKNVFNSLLLRTAKSIYNFCITKAYNVFQKSKKLLANSFFLNLFKSQIILFKKRPLFVFAFYTFVFYLGLFMGDVVENRLSPTKLGILFALFFINLACLQTINSKFIQNSMILKFFKEIFS